mgnify:CR=1 FL=1
MRKQNILIRKPTRDLNILSDTIASSFAQGLFHCRSFVWSENVLQKEYIIQFFHTCPNESDVKQRIVSALREYCDDNTTLFFIPGTKTIIKFNIVDDLLSLSIIENNDLLQSETLVEDAQAYFDDVQTVDEVYTPFIGRDDPPAIEKNADIMTEYRPLLEELYYDPSRFDTYLEQLGIDYPQLEPTEIRRSQ